MSDVGLRWIPSQGAADLSIEANDLASDASLETAVLLSLFTDRRVEGDELRAGETERRGWWADVLPASPGDHFGSRLWLLARSKQTADVLPRAEEYAKEALAWLVEDAVAERIEASAELLLPGVFQLDVVVHRPKAEPADFRFAYAWSTAEVRRIH